LFSASLLIVCVVLGCARDYTVILALQKYIFQNKIALLRANLDRARIQCYAIDMWFNQRLFRITVSAVVRFLPKPGGMYRFSNVSFDIIPQSA
jgi:hypothetical protein